MRWRAARVAVTGAVAALVTLTGCGGDGQDGEEAGVGEPQAWEGAVALTGIEDTPAGVAASPDGSVVVFVTGGHLGAENGLRAVAVDGPATSTLLREGSRERIPNDRLTTDATHVYAGYGRDVVRVPLAGGAPEVIATGRPAEIRYLAVHDGFVYWTTFQFRGNPSVAELARAPVGGGDVEQLALGVAESLGQPQFDGDAVLLASPRGIVRVVPGADPEIVVSSEALGGPPTRLAFDDTTFYVSVAGPREPLRAVPRAGGEPVVVAETRWDTAADLLLVEGTLVGARSSGINNGELVAVDVATGAVRVLARGRFPGPDLALVPGRGVAFAADRRVWLSEL